jgi:hypothetical protein
LPLASVVRVALVVPVSWTVTPAKFAPLLLRFVMRPEMSKVLAAESRNLATKPSENPLCVV